MPYDIAAATDRMIRTQEDVQTARAARASAAQADMISLANFQNEEAQRQIETEAFQRLSSSMKGDGVSTGQPGGEDADFGELFERLGTAMYSAGAPKRGEELIKAGIDYRKKTADVQNTENSAHKTRLEGMVKAGDYMYNALASAQNENEYRQIFRTLPDEILNILGPENIDYLANADWSPDLQAYLRDRALSVKDQANLVLQERRVVNAETATENARQNAAALRALSEGHLKEQKRANDIKEKAGGTNLGAAATNTEIASAKAIILDSVKALQGADTKNEDVSRALDHMSEDVVGRAKQIISENKGVTFNEAVTQAVMEAEAAGDFSIITETKSHWFSPDETITRPGKYQRRGTRQDNPLPLPTGKDEAAIAKRLVKGRYYQTPMGTLRWNGSSFDE